jgi:hypothetical protein
MPAVHAKRSADSVSAPSLIRLLAVILAGWALALILPDTTRLFQPLGTIGLKVDFDGRIAAVENGGPAARAHVIPFQGNRAGDRIDFERTSRGALFGIFGGLGGRAYFPAGRAVTLDLIAPDGSHRVVTLTASQRHPPVAESAVLFLDQLFGVGFILLSLFLAWHFPLRRDVLGFFLYGIWFNSGQDYVFYGLLPLPAALAQQLAAALFQATGLAGFLMFALRFPTDRAEGWRHRVERTLPALVIALTLLALVGSGAAFGHPSLGAWHVSLWMKAAIYALVVAAFLAKLGELSPVDRLRLRWVIFGCIPGLFFFLLAESVDVATLWQPLWDRLQ